MAAEFANVQDWAKHNSTVINLSKTKAINFYNPRAIPIPIPPSISHTEQVTSVKLLGVYIQENFSCDIHFKHIITVSAAMTGSYSWLNSGLFQVRDSIRQAVILKEGRINK